MTIYQYAKMDMSLKLEKIRNEAIFIEHYESNNEGISVYFLDSFFIEVTSKGQLIIDVTPFQRGYKFNKSERHAVEKRNLVFN